jgi:hypothetical protein
LPGVDFFVRFAKAAHRKDWAQLIFYRLALSLPRAIQHLHYEPWGSINLCLIDGTRDEWKWTYPRQAPVVQLIRTRYSISMSVPMREARLIEILTKEIEAFATNLMGKTHGYPRSMFLYWKEYTEFLP